MRKNVSGIYKIINKINGKYYVGSSNDITGIHGRWYEHRNDLTAGRHDNKHLQRAWNKYGSDAFEFVVIKEIATDSILLEEQKYLNVAQQEKGKTYNMNFLATGGGGFTGHKHSAESKLKTSLKLKGRPKGNKGVKRPQSSGIKNPMWKPVSEEQKRTMMSLYTTLGYTKAQRQIRETFGFGGRVFFRVFKELSPIYTHACKTSSQPRQEEQRHRRHLSFGLPWH